MGLIRDKRKDAEWLLAVAVRAEILAKALRETGSMRTVYALGTDPRYPPYSVSEERAKVGMTDAEIESAAYAKASWSIT